MSNFYVERPCDKCGQLVPRHNSAVTLQEIVSGRFAGFVKDRRLNPVDGCEGSPSRVRLVESDHEWDNAYDVLTDE